MEVIRFDFNNMFNSMAGTHGVSEADISEVSSKILAAHQHLSKISGNSRDRIDLGLEWLNLPYQDKKSISSLQDLGADIARRYENVIFLGIGGSYLGLKAAQDAFCGLYYNDFKQIRKDRPKVYFEGNNLDPDTLAVLLKNINPKKTFVVVISKSGETTETKAAFVVVELWLRKALGKNYGRQIIAITDPESGSLRKRVIEEQRKDPLSFRDFPLLKGVGGRFSEFNMGLLHLAIIGISIQGVLDGARDMLLRCSAPDLFSNPAYMYAALHMILYRKKQKSIAVVMPFSETLKSTADWYVQLLAESLGKKYARLIITKPDGSEEWVRDSAKIVHTGRTPASFRGTNDLHSIQQNNIEGENNKVVTFIRVEKFKHESRIPGKNDILSGRRFSELIKLAQEATEWAMLREQRPNCKIIMPEVSAYHWGALLMFFEIATAFEGELLEVNAFDQPGVEGYKNYMYYKLGKSGLSKEIVEELAANPLIKEKKYIF